MQSKYARVEIERRFPLDGVRASGEQVRAWAREYGVELR